MKMVTSTQLLIAMKVVNKFVLLILKLLLVQIIQMLVRPVANNFLCIVMVLVKIHLIQKYLKMQNAYKMPMEIYTVLQIVMISVNLYVFLTKLLVLLLNYPILVQLVKNNISLLLMDPVKKTNLNLIIFLVDLLSVKINMIKKVILFLQNALKYTNLLVPMMVNILLMFPINVLLALLKAIQPMLRDFVKIMIYQLLTLNQANLCPKI